MRAKSILVLAAAVMAPLAPEAWGRDIHTGGETGAYYSTFCPVLQRRLAALNVDYACKPSLGSSANLRAVARTPTDFAFAQFDVFALEAARLGGRSAVTLVRSDLARECVFAVTRNKQLTNYGEIAVNADRLTFILPPRSSGSASTFEFLSTIDPEGLGRARRVRYAADTDDAIRQALSGETALTVFVQFPDPQNERFQEIRRLGGHLVPVIDGLILSQKAGGSQVYFAQETEIEQSRWLRAGRRVVTACTPLVLVSGNPQQLAGRDERLAHRQLIENIQALASSDLMPPPGAFTSLIKQTRTASLRAQEHFLALSNEARERARPFVDRIYRLTREGVRTMIRKAQPQR